MKISIIIDGVSNSGGTDRVACLLANEFTKRNHNVSIYSMSSGDAYYPLSTSVQLKTLPGISRVHKITFFAKLMKKISTDVIIIISMGRLSAETVPILKFMKVRSTIVCSDHVSFNSFNFIIRALKKIAYKLSDHVVVLTEHDKELLLSTRNKIKNVHSIGNISPFETENSLQSKSNIVLAVGMLTEEKTICDLLKIWELTNTTDWELIIIGDGVQKEMLIEHITKSNMNNVRILPATKEIASYYRKAKIIAMTSKYEGLPMVLIEAKSFGTVAISYDCETGPKEIISNDGIVITYGDTAEFSKELEKLIGDEALLQCLSKQALENSQVYSSEHIMAKWNKVIGE